MEKFTKKDPCKSKIFDQILGSLVASSAVYIKYLSSAATKLTKALLKYISKSILLIYLKVDQKDRFARVFKILLSFLINIIALILIFNLDMILQNFVENSLVYEIILLAIKSLILLILLIFFFMIFD